MDKAFRREFGVREELYEDLSRVYRDRRRAPTGLPVRGAAELLGKVPEGQQQHGGAAAARPGSALGTRGSVASQGDPLGRDLRVLRVWGLQGFRGFTGWGGLAQLLASHATYPPPPWFLLARRCCR